MAFHATDRWGAMLSNPSTNQLRELLATLDLVDSEHPDVSVTHESGWCLSAFPSGRLVWENVEDGSHPKHMASLPREQVLLLWLALAAGEVTKIAELQWLDGYGNASAA